jgi:16S rRNA (guanine527-N7)-methyltransferase
VGSSHRPYLAALGLADDPADRLARYLDLLALWSTRANLTGARTPAERVWRLVAPVLPAAALPPAGPLIDVGSGSGSPGLVLALVRPDLEVTLLEPRQKRWAFLREAVRAAGRPDVVVRRERHDQFPGPPALTATLRALALPLADLAGLVVQDGRVVFFGGTPRAEAGWVEERCAEGVRVFRRLAAGPGGRGASGVSR